TTMSWQGQILRVNLTAGTCKAEPLNLDWAKQFIGQRGLASKYLLEEMDPAAEALGPDNKLIIATGALTGTSAPTAGRSSAVCKSPLTNTIAASNTGGYFGAEVKIAGWDMIIFEGRANSPVYLSIVNDQAELRDANHLWGKTVWEVEPAIKKEVGHPSTKVASIGRAGENGVLFACIMNDVDRAYGRSGVGAVMGSKNLKAIAVRGSKGVRPENPAGFADVVTRMAGEVSVSPVRKRFEARGTLPMMDTTNAWGSLPTRNARDVQFEGTKGINSDAMLRTRTTDGKANLKTNKACFACTIACGRVAQLDPTHFSVKGKEGGARYTKPGGGLEYESAFALGPMCGVDDIEAATYVNHLCNEDGMDPISLGVTIATAMELFEEGVLTEADTNGIALRFGSAEAMVHAAELTVANTGIGREIALGAQRLCEKYGRPELSVTVKGQEIPAYDGRAMKGMALAYATSSRGACHMRARPFVSDFKTLDLDGKAKVVKDTQDMVSAVDSSGLCAFVMNAVPFPYLVELLDNALPGTWTEERLLQAGERIYTVERLFNLRAGLTGKDDTLPHKMLKEAAKSGAAQGQVVDLAPMLADYYALRGWDENGVPTNATLDRVQP
ncbi:MAG: aldehyde ferredoxin oxidoreductase family protein, partial [Magnetospiraceae bacterium]